MYLLKECQRLLQRPKRELLEAPQIREESFRPLDVVVMEETVQKEADAAMEDEHARDDDCNNVASASLVEEAAMPGVSPEAFAAPSSIKDEEVESIARHSAVQPVSEGCSADHQGNTEQPAGGDHCELEEEVHIEEVPRTRGLTNTTSAHDDWLHRGPFLHDLDLHTYVRHVHRTPRPRKTRNEERRRRVPLFLFDSHYVLAQQYVQELDVQGQCKVVVLEALKCPSPELNDGEDNSSFKSVLGTLLTCPGRGHCNNPLMCRAQFFQCRYPNSDDEASVFTCRHQWRARRADIEVLARRADAKSHRAKRIPVLADVTLLRSHRASEGAVSEQQENNLPWSGWIVYTQLWMRIGQTGYPPWASRILEYLGHVMHHPDQLTLAEFAAVHLREVIFNLDMLSVARTAKLTHPPEKLTAEDEGEREEAEKEALLNSVPGNVEDMGGAAADMDIEEEEMSVDRTIALHSFEADVLKEMMLRVTEVAEGKKKGRTKHADVQMKLFDDRFHQQLHQEVPQSNAKLFEQQVSYSLPQAQAAALLFQEEVLKKLRQQRDEGEDQHASEDVVENVLLAEAMSHNSAAERSDREWIPLEDSLLGPAHVAKLLIRKVQEKRSTPERQYRLNAEQLECVALFVSALDKGFFEPSRPK